MSNIINVEMVFDTQTLLKKYGNISQDPQHPTGINHSDVYMVTEAKYVADPATQATADLAIKAEVDDVIRWRGLSLSDNISQSAIPYKIQKFDGQQVTTVPVPSEATPWVPVPNQNPDKSVDPLHYTAQKIPNYYLGCDVTDSGKEAYQVWFYIAEQVTGSQVNVLGYLYWDPSISVA
jgi:nematocidal protein AidA